MLPFRGVESTRPPSTLLMVSFTLIAAIAAPVERASSTVESIISGVTSGRAPSWTTISSGASRSSRRASPFPTEP